MIRQALKYAWETNMESLDVSLRLLRVSTTGQEASSFMSHLSITECFFAFTDRKLTGRRHYCFAYVNTDRTKSCTKPL